VRTFVDSGDEVLAPDRSQFDLTRRDTVVGALTWWGPDVVVHAGAWTDVDGCETDPERAFLVNALGTRHVADGARRIGAHMVLISTDYVFAGDLDRPYHEWDEPRPLSVYGRSKLAAERELSPTDTVVRTSWVCGVAGDNVVKTVLRLATDPVRELAFVDDQRGCPTFAADLAPAVRRLAAARLPGTYHVTNQGPTTWYGFARQVLAAASHDPDRVRPITTAELDPPRAAARPANSVLDNAALRMGGLALLPPWQESLPALVAALGGAG
jgi:dTDP-4-dehydrorhamnose reductase